MPSQSIVVAALLLYGCSTTPSTDRQWSHLVCSGGSAEWTDCWKKAQEMCPNGFVTANKEEQRSSLKREVDVSCK